MKKTVIVILVLLLLTAAFLAYGWLVFGWFNHNAFYQFESYEDAAGMMDEDALKILPDVSGYESCIYGLYYDDRYDISDAEGYSSFYFIATEGEKRIDLWCTPDEDLPSLSEYENVTEKTVSDTTLYFVQDGGANRVLFTVSGNYYNATFGDGLEDGEISEFLGKFISAVKG